MAKQTPPTDVGQEEVQQRVDQENDQGFRGTKVDPTPNAAYTVNGVLKDKPTPETDSNAARDAEQATV